MKNLKPQMKLLLVRPVFFFLVSCICSAAVFAAPHAFPVPFNQKNPAHTAIYFEELPSAGSIEIYTISGELVKEIKFDAIHPDPLPWDLLSSSNHAVASGVYIYRIEGDGHKTIGKLVVIR